METLLTGCTSKWRTFLIDYQGLRSRVDFSREISRIDVQMEGSSEDISRIEVQKYKIFENPKF